MADTLPLFPLRSVLFPGGLLNLKVFEARYLDLVTTCWREQRPFGVVCLLEGPQAGLGEVRFEPVGVCARVAAVDAAQAGILQVSCQGLERFALAADPLQGEGGLWAAQVRPIDPDPRELPDPAYQASVVALARAIASLRAQGQLSMAEPFALDDAGWVANRWCELLPIPLQARQKLMALQAPQIRLKLVHEYLSGKKVV